MSVLELLGVFGGLALFLHGMQMMSSGLEAAAGSRMKAILEKLTANRFMGVLVGALITAAVQSSSATTVMVVGFANAGMMTLNQAVWLIMGANVGTTVTGLLIALDVGALAPVAAFAGVFLMVFVKRANLQHIGQILAGLGTGRNAKRATCIHLLFNVIGTVLFTAAVLIFPIVPAIVVDQLRNELHRMLEMARQNVDTGFKAVLDRDTAPLERVEQREEYIDFLNREISRYVSRLIAVETNERGSRTVSSFFTIAGNIERIGDHADNLAGYTRLLAEKDIPFTPFAQEEIKQMRDVTLRAVSALFSGEAGNGGWLSQVARLEQRIDDMAADFRRAQLVRMREGTCSDEACILFSELLTDFERMGDHVLNIAQELTRAETTL